MARTTLRDVRRKYYFQIDNRVIDLFGESLGASAMAVYMALVRHGNATEETIIRIARIGKDVGLGMTAVREALKRLEGAELIAVNTRLTPNGQRASQYVLLDVPYDLREDWKERKIERLVVKEFGPPESGGPRTVADLRANHDTSITVEPTGIRGAGPPESEGSGHQIPGAAPPESGDPPIEERNLLEEQREGAIEPFAKADLGGLTAQVFWTKVLSTVVSESGLRPDVMEQWFRGTRLLGCRPDGSVVFEAGGLQRRRIQERYLDAVRSAVSGMLGREIEIEVVAATERQSRT